MKIQSIITKTLKIAPTGVGKHFEAKFNLIFLKKLRNIIASKGAC